MFKLLQVIAAFQFAPYIIYGHILLDAFLDSSLHGYDVEKAVHANGPSPHERAKEMTFSVDCVQDVLVLAVGLFIPAVRHSRRVMMSRRQFWMKV